MSLSSNTVKSREENYNGAVKQLQVLNQRDYLAHMAFLSFQKQRENDLARGIHFNQNPPNIPDYSQKRRQLMASVLAYENERYQRITSEYERNEMKQWVVDVERAKNQETRNDYQIARRDLQAMGLLLHRHITGEIDSVTFTYESRRWMCARWDWFTNILKLAPKSY